jgi:mono/diheme cytochrome c family protein
MKYHTTLTAAAMILIAGCGKKEVSTPEENPASAAQPATVAAEPVKHPLPGDPEAGKVVYLRICSACHQPDGSGMNGLLAANFVKDKSRLAKTNEQLLKSIREGIVADGKIMPPQKDILSDKEMADALSYIRKTFGD